MTGFRYAAKAKKKAVERYASGVSSKAVAAEFGTTPNSVLEWARKEGVEVRPRGVAGGRPRRVPISDKDRKAARYAATMRLLELHRADFDALYDEELAARRSDR